MRMTKVTWERARVTAPFALVLALLAGFAPGAVSGQDRSSECHCVDADGEVIDDCSCFRTPDFERFSMAFTGAAERPRLGVSVNARQESRYDATGAYVTDVFDEGPAWDAGIREGDVITRIDGQLLTESIGASAERDFDLDASAPVQRLLALAGAFDDGDEVEVEYVRDGERVTVTLQAEELDGAWGSSFSFPSPSVGMERMLDGLRTWSDDRGGVHLRSAPGASPRVTVVPGGGDVRVFGSGDRLLLGEGGFWGHGLELVELNPELGSYFGATEGVLVVDARRSSNLGLEAGDVVLRIGDRTVDTPDRFSRILASYGDEEDITFHVRRDGSAMEVTGRKRY